MGNSSSRSDVVRTLKAHEVFVALEDESKNLYNLEREEFLEAIVLPDPVPMARLQDFKRKLKIPIQHFWRPEEAESAAAAKKKLEDENR